jgi:hypothetical protein
MSRCIGKLVAKIPTEILQIISLKLGTKCLAIGNINNNKKQQNYYEIADCDKR